MRCRFSSTRRKRTAVTMATMTTIVVVLGGALDAAREEIADEDVGAGPKAGAEDAVGDEGAVAHAGAAGDEGSEGAHETDEAADEDRLAAVAGEVVLDLFEAFVANPEAGPVLEHELAAESEFQLTIVNDNVERAADELVGLLGSRLVVP